MEKRKKNLSLGKESRAVNLSPFFLYANTDKDSQEAIALLALLGHPMEVVWCKKGQEEVLPTLVHSGRIYKGLEEIKAFKGEVDFQIEQGDGLVLSDPRYSGIVVRYDLMRTNKSLDEITAADIPQGFDADDVCALNPDGSLMVTRPHTI